MNEKQMNFLSWLGALAGGLVAITAFAFTNFETKSDSQDKQSRLESRLERMETKIDDLQRDLRKR